MRKAVARGISDVHTPTESISDVLVHPHKFQKSERLVGNRIDKDINVGFRAPFVSCMRAEEVKRGYTMRP